MLVILTKLRNLPRRGGLVDPIDSDGLPLGTPARIFHGIIIISYYNVIVIQ